MAIFGDDDAPGVLDKAFGSVDESVARQFDSKPGGGVVDETIAVLDPTRSASQATEADLGQAPQPTTTAADSMEVPTVWSGNVPSGPDTGNQSDDSGGGGLPVGPILALLALVAGALVVWGGDN